MRWPNYLLSIPPTSNRFVNFTKMVAFRCVCATSWIFAPGANFPAWRSVRVGIRLKLPSGIICGRTPRPSSRKSPLSAGLSQMMNYLCAIIGAALLACIAIAATAIALLCRPPACPVCKSREVDEHPWHCICRTCGQHWEEPKRFGNHGGSDLWSRFSSASSASFLELAAALFSSAASEPTGKVGWMGNAMDASRDTGTHGARTAKYAGSL